MGFDQLTPRPFNRRTIGLFAPNLPGVYGISNAREWLYIGIADNLQSTLQSIMEDSGSDLMRLSPTGFIFEVCEGSRRHIRQERLTQEYSPAFNPISTRQG